MCYKKMAAEACCCYVIHDVSFLFFKETNFIQFFSKSLRNRTLNQ
jgi:hypothetical protein